MASLQILKGLDHEQDVAIGDRLVLGRDPDCDVVIPDGPVSRNHARIVRDQGKFYLEDLKSRNHTYLNDRKVEPGERALLRNHDRIKICDFLAAFEEESLADSSVKARLSHSSQLLVTQPAEKLRVLLEVSSQLS